MKGTSRIILNRGKNLDPPPQGGGGGGRAQNERKFKN